MFTLVTLAKNRTPSFELFEKQDAAYRQSVLPNEVKRRIAVEAGIRQGWDRYIGRSE